RLLEFPEPGEALAQAEVVAHVDQRLAHAGRQARPFGIPVPALQPPRRRLQDLLHLPLAMRVVAYFELRLGAVLLPPWWADGLGLPLRRLRVFRSPLSVIFLADVPVRLDLLRCRLLPPFLVDEHQFLPRVHLPGHLGGL